MNPDDPEDYSRIIVSDTAEEPPTHYDKMDFNRMHDKVKKEMYAKYSDDPATWTVEKLATDYSVSQPRVQAILLLQEWEKRDRAAGLITEEDDLREDMVHEAHLRSVRKLEEQDGVKIETDKYKEQPVKTTGGPLRKFRVLTDTEPFPKKPDSEFYVNKLDASYKAERKLDAEHSASHKKVSNKRWTYVIKDSTRPNVK
jgi:hypothetical protein